MGLNSGVLCAAHDVTHTVSVINCGCAQVGDWQSAKSIYEFSAKDIDGEVVSLDKYRGYVCIIVNVASK